MRYLGNKTKLLNFIDFVMDKYNIEGEVFADLFAGTASVGDHMKNRFKVYSNDFMYYSYVFSKAKLMNSEPPLFTCFRKKYGVSPFEWLNKREYIPSESTFIYNNYTLKANRKFFTEKNALKIDGIRIDIEDFYQEKIISEAEYFFLLGSLLESVTKVSNTSGTYEAFFKFWESRASKDFIIEPLKMEKSLSVDSGNLSFNEDTNFLLRQISGDIAYIDTPYTTTQYASAYHLLETIARYDFPEIAGKTGRRQKNRKMSNYSRKQRAKDAFEDMFRQIQFDHVLISYSDQSIVPVEELIELASHFAVNGEVKIEEVPYREYKNLNYSHKGKGKSLHEVIIYFKKDRTIVKSPLNYSGSKDTLLLPIFKELPYHVNTFIDAMGGAFNVGANVTALDTVVYNELNPFVYEIIKMLMTSDKNKLVDKIEKIIKKYKLRNTEKREYLAFRDFYNFKEKSALNLFILHMYAFQNLIRFNRKFEFNTPVGNAGYNENLKQRIIHFCPKSPNLIMRQGSFEKINFNNYEKGTVFYFDPPYLVTTAEYNDGKRGFEGWNSDLEAKLLSFLCQLDKSGYYFMLSNVMEHQGKVNNLLKEWINSHKYNVIEIGETGSRYPRKEILVKNFE